MSTFFIQQPGNPKRFKLVKLAWDTLDKAVAKQVNKAEVYCFKCDAITPTHRNECCLCGHYKD